VPVGGWMCVCVACVPLRIWDWECRNGEYCTLACRWVRMKND